MNEKPRLRMVLGFAFTLLLGLAAWPWLEAPLAHAFRGLCSLTLGPLTFGSGGHIAFAPAPPSAPIGIERAASWDVRMRLSIEGVEKAHAIALNPRRLLYLPLVTLSASVLALPLSLRQKRSALLAGAPILIVLALCSVWVIAAFLFAQVPGLVYSLSPVESGVLRLVYEGWVTPLTNKFIVPLLLAYGLFAWQRRSQLPVVHEQSPKVTPARSVKRAPKRGGDRKRKSARRG